jgi:uncharacterized protein YacL
MIYVVRAIFLILVSTVASIYLSATIAKTLEGKSPVLAYVIMLGGVVVSFILIAADILMPRKNLSTLSGVLFGIVVGMLVSLGLGFLIEQATNILMSPGTKVDYTSLIEGAKLLLALMVCYVTVSFILQTKDDFRFIIPYVEFSRATKGPRPLVIDTSVIIDGRIVEVAATGIFESPLLVPRFVLHELQTIADSGDRLKRSRGRRGLEVLEKLKGMPRLDMRIWEGTLTNSPESDGVDQKLVLLAQQENGRIMTNDFNLNKIAALRGITVININSIADALKPVVLPGESMKVRVVKPGEGPTQGVGYLEDGTMVVVEGARDKIGMEVELVVTNALQTAAGKMIFGRTDNAGHVPAHAPAPVRTRRE